MKSVMITGNAGFIGSNFTKYLKKNKWSTFGFDIANGNRYDAVKYFENADSKFDLLIHAAANVGGRAAIDKAPLWVARNMAIDQAMFNWAVRTKTPVLYFSSSAAYPTYLQEGEYNIALRENDIKLKKLHGTPDNTYGWSKLTGEFMASVAREHGARVHVVRPFSGYGTTQSPDYPFGSFLKKAKARTKTFEVWSDGTQTRDWIHVDDIMRACMAIFEADIEEPVNLSTGRGVDFTRLANMFMTAAGNVRPIEYSKDAPRGCSYRVGDPTFLNTIYKPKITIEEGIARALKGKS
jgi:nucleoside-diphosphate-sugar epimerase